jgi:creatinine amidohydrolase/Fe(II)-dependent formamide hydrolase-like protein
VTSRWNTADTPDSGWLTVLVPIGSTERHGPHLPLDTDTVIATAVARGSRTGSAHRCADSVAPAAPYGAAASTSRRSGWFHRSPRCG